MDCIFNNPGFWTVIGVLIGLLGGEGVHIWREKRKINKLKKVIQDELRSIKGQLPFQINIIGQCLEHMAEGRILRLERVRHITTGYYSSITYIYNNLTLTQRNCLHNIYEQLRIADETMDNFENDLKRDRAMLTMEINKLIKMYTGKISDVKNNYATTIELIDSYLEGKPIDVYRVEKSE